MAQPAALLILPSPRPNGQKAAADQATTQMQTQCLDDLHLAERIAHALHATGHGPLRRIAVTVYQRLVILTGCVPTYYLKQVAQATALTVPGTWRVRNDLDVVRPARREQEKSP